MTDLLSIINAFSPTDALWVGLFAGQLPATIRLLLRLGAAAYRYPPFGPTPLKRRQGPVTAEQVGSVSIVVPTLNEVHRLSPCLTGLMQQGPEVREILVVDSHSQDGTRELVEQFGQRDPRIKLLTDTPLPPGWVGRPWALQYGYQHSSPDSQWILGIDADTQPLPGLVQKLIEEAQQCRYDVVSLSPRFIVHSPGETWLHPALLTTLLYRTNAWGSPAPDTQQVLANGQCFLCRRAVLSTVGGYASARSSFCDDVPLARHVAAAGFTVRMLAGSRLLKVRMYEGAAETWREWGRSLALKDASTKTQLQTDLYLLLTTQALPLPLLLALLLVLPTVTESVAGLALLGLNAFLLLLRLILLLATAHCYDRSQARGGWLYWFSPLLDPLAVLRIFLSAFHVPTHWRGRTYFPLLRKQVSS